MYEIVEMEEPSPAKVNFVCERCGSESVTADFICEWNYDEQCWQIVESTGGDDYCSNCECETVAIDENDYVPQEED